MSKQNRSLTVTINVEIEPGETFEALAEIFGYEKTKPSKFEIGSLRRAVDEIERGDSEEPDES